MNISINSLMKEFMTLNNCYIYTQRVVLQKNDDSLRNVVLRVHCRKVIDNFTE